MQRIYTLCLLLPLHLSAALESVESEQLNYDPIFSISSNFTHASPDYSSCTEALLYWAQQQFTISPACYVHVRTAWDISAVLSIARTTECPFAVRGGGHSDVPGASNSPGGITLDLSGLNQIETTDDGKVTRVGAGLKWGEVYGELEKRNLTVVGGRLTSVGVAGLTLGGGISYLSGLYGFACDNVKNFEVVLANGSIVDVSLNSHPDLYRSLRGGGNNFGIVSRFDLDTYPQGPMWGGLHIWQYKPEVTIAITSAFTKFSNSAASDPKASLFMGLGYKHGMYAYVAGLQYSLPTAFPPIFSDFNTDPAFTTSGIVSTARITTLSDLADELDKAEPPGIRILDVGLQVAEGFAPMMGFQPLTSNILQQMGKRGGNVLGLSTEDAPLMVCSFGWEWSSEIDDALVISGIENVRRRSVTAAKEMGLYHDYIYMNYAAPDQEPVESYGEQEREFLKMVQEKYDPEGVFRRLVPGGFKVK
ncbi:FAD-binding domain-containing protein [Wilcoxina mikolae CBS 423.85]|nr:FAD-binding domain-containing protein [Wilcoxina mikolae CBS 423.85]